MAVGLVVTSSVSASFSDFIPQLRIGPVTFANSLSRSFSACAGPGADRARLSAALCASGGGVVLPRVAPVWGFAAAVLAAGCDEAGGAADAPAAEVLVFSV